MTIEQGYGYPRDQQTHSRFAHSPLFTPLMLIDRILIEGGMLAKQYRCYDAPMKKCLLATLLVMVVAAPAFAATKHHRHVHQSQSHPAHHHHHHKA